MLSLVCSAKYRGLRRMRSARQLPVSQSPAALVPIVATYVLPNLPRPRHQLRSTTTPTPPKA
jgi:hypothetical protein